MSDSGDKPFLIKCPKCGKQLRVGAQIAGKRIKCPGCSQPVKVPGGAAAKDTESDWLQLDLEQEKTQASPKQPESSGRRQSTAAEQVSAKLTPESDKSTAKRPVTSKMLARTTAAKQVRAISDGSDQALADANRTLAGGGTETPAAPPSPAGPARSLFDDDLPELSALEPPPVRSNMSALLGVEGLEDLQNLVPPVLSKAAKASPNAKQGTKSTAQAQYRVACLICGTPQYVMLAQQGRKVQCPDCHSEFRIPAPPPNWKPSDQAGPHSFSTDLAKQSQAEVEGNEARARENAKEYLRQAETELNDDDLDSLYQGDFDTSTFVKRTFGFCFDNMALLQLAVFSMIFAVIGSVFQWANQNALAGDKGYFLISALAMPLCQLLAAGPLFAAAMTLLESLANDQPKVGHWPGANFFEQLGELLVFAAALLLAALPGVLLGLLIGRSGGMNWLILIGGMFSCLLLFPVILLGMLDNGSLFNPISMNVLRSVTLGTESWGAYYMKTAVAFFAVFIVLTILSSGPALVAGLGWAAMPWLVFFTSQQTGILASDINQHLSLHFRDTEDQAADDDADEP